MASPDTSFHFTTALITGGGGGIGKALAAYFVSQGKKVLLAGRTESKLRATAAEIGAAGYYVLDTGDTGAIPAFARRLTAEHPDVDCLVNNAGVQRPLRVLHDEGQDLLRRADEEIDINIRGPMHLAVALLPHFRSLDEGALVVNVSSLLGFVPVSIINPCYNGTKAWLHFWTVALRTQLRDTSVRVVEIAPPTVETDLHREREDPDDNKKDKNPGALSIDEFMDYVKRGLEGGKETIGAGISVDVVEKWYDAYGAQYEKAAAGWK